MVSIMDKTELIWLRLRKRFLEEDGDTNFISIIIILTIVLGIAIVFIIFRKQVLGWFQTIAETFGGKMEDVINETYE
ncbi:MAG: hypothetical protein IKS18_05090 [Lachnospiraceae bacterium]|nr:hypothetical protein [Lachnospiraceae bacterium]